MHNRFLTEPGRRLPCPTFEPPCTTYCFSCLCIDHAFISWLLPKTRPCDKLNIQKKTQHNQKKTRYSGDPAICNSHLIWGQIRESQGWCRLLKPVSFLKLLNMLFSNSSCCFPVSFKPHNLCLCFHKLFFSAWVLPFIWNQCGYMGENKLRIWS